MGSPAAPPARHWPWCHQHASGSCLCVSEPVQVTPDVAAWLAAGPDTSEPVITLDTPRLTHVTFAQLDQLVGHLHRLAHAA